MELKSHYGTIVIGAGPAGVLASVYASAYGSVLLVEAMSLPREKSCGGMLNEYSQAFLNSVSQLPADLICEPEWINFRYFNWDKQVKKPTKLRFMNVDRVKFDDWLMSMLPSNVDVLEQTRFCGCAQDAHHVSVALKSAAEASAAEFKLSCDYLIGADGPRSTVRRSLPVSQLTLYKTLQEFLPATHMEPFFDCLYSKEIGDNYGYGYTIPKDGMAIIGSVFFPGSKNCLEAHEKAVDVFRSYYGYGTQQRKRREAWTAVKVNSVADIVGGHGRVLLAGEAGGIMSPSSGEGISFAMNSGKLAGKAVATQGKHRGNGSEVLECYRASLGPIKKNIGRRLRYFPLLNSDFGKMLGTIAPNFVVDKVAHQI
ncbi:MAG: FAD-dependent monooxygenase [Coriobacteriales bacterium]